MFGEESGLVAAPSPPPVSEPKGVWALLPNWAFAMEAAGLVMEHLSILQQVLPGSWSHPQHWGGDNTNGLGSSSDPVRISARKGRKSYVFAACSNSEGRQPEPQFILQPVGGPASHECLLYGLQSHATCGW